MSDQAPDPRSPNAGHSPAHGPAPTGCDQDHGPGAHEHPAHDHGHDHDHGHGHDHDHGHDHHHHSSEKAFHTHGAEIELDFSIMVGISLLCGAFLVFGLVATQQNNPLLATICFGLAILVGGAVPMLEALPSLMRMQPDIESLMVFAALGAWVLGEPREGAFLMLLFSGARAMEAIAVGKARQSLRALKEHWKENATRLLADGSEESVPIAELEIGDRVLVRPGERLPLDARVESGASSVNEAAITGEPLPVDKAAGDGLYGGTLNLQGALVIEITSTVGESTLARTIRLLEDAQEQEALTQRVVEWTTDRYSTIVLLATIFLITIPHLYFREPLHDAIWRGLTLLVVASPCALAVSTPATLFFAITAAARRGILLKGGVHLEAAAAVRVVALDKTGTLTRGEPHVTGVHVARGEDENALLAAAAAIERLSEHPLAKPVVDEARERGLELPEAEEFEAVVGRGVRARVNGVEMAIGSPSWMRELGITMPVELHEIEAPLEARGERTLLVGARGRVIAMIAVADTLRPEAVALVRDLKRTGIKRVVMLTGDTRPAAETIAAACGLDEVRAELLPGDKLAALEELKETYGRVIMVGDGVNDAPALARADVGVAMGGIGSDLALESADVVLTTDDLWRLPAFIDLAKKSTRMLLFNLAFSLAVIAVLVTTVFLSVRTQTNMSLITAVIGHEGSTIFVVLNAMRLLRWRSRYDHRL